MKVTVIPLVLGAFVTVPKGQKNKLEELKIKGERIPTSATIAPVIIGALGMIKKTIGKNINKIPGSSSLYEMQRIALCGIAYLL